MIGKVIHSEPSQEPSLKPNPEQTPAETKQQARVAKELKSRVAKEQELKLHDLQSLMNLQSKFDIKIDDAVKALKQAMALAVILDQQANSGWYQEINARYRLRTKSSTKVIYAALGHLMKVAQLSKVIVPAFERDIKSEINTPPVFE